MIQLLCSNYPPLKTKNKSFQEVFFSQLKNAKEVMIASGYISENSVAELLGYYEQGYQAKLELIVGMHYFDGFTQTQYDGLMKLSEVLKSKKLGDVSLARVSRYHGKIYSFLDNNNKRSTILGSSNLSKINTTEKIYDSDIFISEDKEVDEINSFLKELKIKYCDDIDVITTTDIRIITKSNLFDDYLFVDKVEPVVLADVMSKKLGITFEIPLKVETQSNLNCYFGKGRENKRTGFIAPRHWYEVEIIPPIEIRRLPHYPLEKQVFTVFTDDGYKFECETNGQENKNLRSHGDLKILGRWIKGRMEVAGALKIGEVITSETLNRYGKNKIQLTKTSIDNTWFLELK